MQYIATSTHKGDSLTRLVCWTGQDAEGNDWNVVATESRNHKSAEEDARAIAAALNAKGEDDGLQNA